MSDLQNEPTRDAVTWLRLFHADMHHLILGSFMPDCCWVTVMVTVFFYFTMVHVA